MARVCEELEGGSRKKKLGVAIRLFFFFFKTPSAIEPLPDESEKQKCFFFFLNGSHHNSYIKKEKGHICLKEASHGMECFQDQAVSRDTALHSPRG